MESLRVLVWNVDGCRAGRDAVADVIAACAPDLACLNEVTRGDAMEIGRGLGMIATSSARWRHRLANAILTTGAFEHVRCARLPHPRGTQRRSAATVHWRGLHVVTTHLGLSPEERLGQMRRALMLCAPPAILAGDLNETPDGAAFRLALATLRDAGADAGDTFPSRGPRARIDACFVSPGIEVVSSEVLDVRGSDHRPLVVVLQAPRAAS